MIGPLLGAVVAAYTALMHCHRPHRFNPPDDDADGPSGAAAAASLPLSSLAKRAFRCARKELDQLARIFGLRDQDLLRRAVAPELLAVTRPATSACATHGMHAADGPISTEAASIMQDLHEQARSPSFPENPYTAILAHSCFLQFLEL